MFGRRVMADLRRFAREATAVQRAVVHLAFRRLRLNHTPTPAEIESTMRLIDSGALDEMLECGAPPARPAQPERFADLQQYDQEAWRARHDIKD